MKSFSKIVLTGLIASLLFAAPMSGICWVCVGGPQASCTVATWSDWTSYRYCFSYQICGPMGLCEYRCNPSGICSIFDILFP
jgi:hypothetical protein